MRRRQFMVSGALILGSSACSPGKTSAFPDKPGSGLSRVVMVRDQAYKTVGQAPDELAASEMIARAVRTLTGAPDLAQAWKAILRNAQTLGLKPNCLSKRGVCSSPAFVQALCRQITDNAPGVKRLIVWERSDRDLADAGFEIVTRGKVCCYGNDRAGYDPNLIVDRSVGSLFTRTVTRDCDALINLPVLKDHGIVGISVCMKNYYGAVHNPNKYHLNRGDPYVADLNRQSCLHDKTVLNLCEAFTAQYEGGPPFMPQWSWPAAMVIASFDPVAMDSVGWRMIEEKRAAHGLKSLAQAGREPSYIATAADSDHRLGRADPKLIEKIELS